MFRLSHRCSLAVRCFAVLLLSLWGATGGALGASLKVVAWNLQWFPGGGPEATPEQAQQHMKAVQQALKQIQPDVFIGQEVRDWQAFDELVSAVPGLKTHVVSSFRGEQTREIQHQQIGIASKLRCQGAWWNEFKVMVPRASRGYSFAALQHPGTGKLLMIYGVHLKSNRGGDSAYLAQLNATARNDQVRQIIASTGEAVQSFGGQAVEGWVIGGDINTNQDGQFPQCRVVQMFENLGFQNTWRNVPREERLTWRGEPDAAWEPTTFDYFFVNGFATKIRARMVDVSRELSDHYPIMIELP